MLNAIHAEVSLISHYADCSELKHPKT